jgi:hypothetical protein
MLALRVQAARCQNWRACVFARSCVTATRSASAIQGASRPTATGTSYSAAMFERSKACVFGQRVLVPKPSASRW